MDQKQLDESFATFMRAVLPAGTRTPTQTRRDSTSAMDDTIAPAAGKVCACGSDDIGAVALLPGQPGHGTHHGKFVCCRCSRFNGWVPNPKVTVAADERGVRIKALLDGGKLSDWQRTFVQSISRQRHLTDKQQAVWQRIVAKTGI